MGILGLEFENNFSIFEKTSLEFSELQNFVKKIKVPKLGTQNALFGYFWARSLQKTIVIFEISTLKFV